ncbi:MAG: hypothetical protein IPP77_14815 [Bacteroidetes bacterium]|nr:hypothetical protein [Bacteroidota bacterium]
MNIETNSWTYEEFLAFILLYAAEMNQDLSPNEMKFIEEKTGVEDIDRIRQHLDKISDTESIETIDHYKKVYLTTTESTLKAKRDLEALLKTPGVHSQFEKAAVHMIEKLI